jgi:tetratricopeptide (TPR) repeat protein
VRAGKADTSIVFDVYDKVSTSAEVNIKNGGGKSFQTALDNIEAAFTPWASCVDLIRIYDSKFKQSPEDIDLLKKITSVLDKKGCTDNDLYFEAALTLHKLEPSAESAMAMGRMSLNRKRYSDAVSFFDQAFSLFEDNDKKADVMLLQADANRQMNSFGAARNSALKAAALRPSDGTPYLIIGDLYASSANQCGEDEFTKRTVYWVAVDKYQKARLVNPSDNRINDLASQRIAQYSRQFPIKSDIFFQGLSVGASYNVGCWINESTSIRSSD